MYKIYLDIANFLTYSWNIKDGQCWIGNIVTVQISIIDQRATELVECRHVSMWHRGEGGRRQGGKERGRYYCW